MQGSRKPGPIAEDRDEVAPPSAKGDRAISLGDEARQRIGGKLRPLHAEIEAEPIPDRFIELLRALAEDEAKPG